MAERTGQIIEYNGANKQGLIKPDDNGPSVRFYLKNLSDTSVEPKPGFKVTFDAPALRMNKKREQVQDPASSVTVTDTSIVLEKRVSEPRRQERGRKGGRRQRDFRDTGGRDLRGPRGGAQSGGERPRREPRSEGRDRGLRVELGSAQTWRHAGRRVTGAADRDGAVANRRPESARKASTRRGSLSARKGQVSIDNAAQHGRTVPFGPPVCLDVRRLLPRLGERPISPALLFDKFPKVMPMRRGKGRGPAAHSFSEQAKYAFFKRSFIPGYHLCWENQGAWKSLYARQVALIKSLQGSGYRAFSFAARLTSPLVLSPWRVSSLPGAAVMLERTYGYPRIPASTVRGVLRRFIETESGTDKTSGRKIFGGDPDPAVVFLDALPVRPPEIEIDVQTCHFPGWYMAGEPPSDDQVPRPFYFLTVKPGSEFVFSLLLERGADGVLLEQAGSLLRQALCQHGLGAKLQLGYGLFSV